MFDLGMQELIVIFVIALIVFGPKRLPELARSLGKGVSELRKTLHDVKEQIDSEVGEVTKPVKENVLDSTNLTSIIEDAVKAPAADTSKEKGGGIPSAGLDDNQKDLPGDTEDHKKTEESERTEG
jgi:Tat protein translocase TatB subunit